MPPNDIQFFSNQKGERYVVYKKRRYYIKSKVKVTDADIVRELQNIRELLDKPRRKKRKKKTKKVLGHPLEVYGYSSDDIKLYNQARQLAQLTAPQLTSRALTHSGDTRELHAQSPQKIKPPTTPKKISPPPKVEEVSSDDDDDDTIVGIRLNNNKGLTPVPKRLVQEGLRLQKDVKELSASDREKEIRILLSQPYAYLELDRLVYNIPPDVTRKDDVINFVIKHVPHDALLDDARSIDEFLSGNGPQTDDGLWKHQLEKILHDIPGFVGVFSLKDFHHITFHKDTNHFSFILNIGYHWVAVRVDSNTIEYYDSEATGLPRGFMMSLQPILKKHFPGSIFQLKVNTVRAQSPALGNCGFHAARFLIDRANGKTWKEATFFETVDRSVKGEAAVKKFKENLKQFKKIKF